MRTNQFRAIMLVLLMAVICLGTMNAQTITVTGIVTDAADGTSITGCSVVNNRSKSGAITDVNGRYSIQAQKGDVLLFRFIGYKEEKRVVKSAKLDVKMKTDDVALEECVVVGYGTMKTKAMSGAYVAVCPTAMYDMDTRMNTEEYDRIQENGFKSVADTPLSTFSIDVDPASYSNMRRFINRGELPPADAIRTEELVNYFSYDYPKPTGNDPVKITVEAGTCTWNTAHRLVRIGLKAKEIPTEQLPASNLVFLIDVSGSMWIRPMATAIGLAIYFAERNRGAYHNLFMAFSEKSEFVSLKGETLEQKVQCVKSVGWGMNTNLQAAFEHVLETALDHDVPPEEMPKALIVVSDMEIDACVDENWMFYDHMKEKYEYSGYQLPNVVFWNVNSRHDLFHIDSKRKGVQLYSGESVTTFRNLLGNIDTTPAEAMEQIIESERYACVRTGDVEEKM